ncbi:MAG: hypothetical protein H0Z38_04870 [Firmicutes bacterium]|nr:hypothetical protein [Bacillota bacterium]
MLPKTTAVTPFGLVLGAGVHLLLSALFGAVFAALVPEFGSKVLWGLGYGALLGYIVGLLTVEKERS